jgi:hypothetical protein
VGAARRADVAGGRGGVGRLRRGAGGGGLGASGDDARLLAVGIRGADGRFRTADADFSTGGGGGGERGVVLRPLPLVRHGAGGGHWEQRLGVKLAQGEASLVLGAIASARADAQGFSGRKVLPEWSSCLRPTASHASASKGGLASPTITRT